MKQLIYPAIALMNRLPMVYKFSLISILFLLPIGGLSWLVMSQLNQSVQTMTRGVEGLEQLRKVEELLAASMAYRDYRAPGVLKNEDALLAASDDQAETIDATLESLLAEQHSFDTSGSWAQQVTAIQEDWQALRANDNYQGNIDPQFKYYQAAPPVSAPATAGSGARHPGPDRKSRWSPAAAPAPSGQTPDST